MASIRSVLPALALLILALPWPGCAQTHDAGVRVVCEEVSPHSALEAAGLRPGDELVAWRLLVSGRSDHGTFDNPFLWYWLETEIAPRGPVLLDILRGGKAMQLTVESRKWDVYFTTNRRALSRVRPELPPENETLYHAGGTKILAGAFEKGIALWMRIADSTTVHDTVRAWILQRVAEEYGYRGAWEEAESVLNRALASGDDPWTRLSLLELLGKTFEYRGQTLDAEDVFREALALRTEHWGADSLSAARSWHRMGGMAFGRGDLERALRYFEKSLTIRSAAAPGSLAEADSLHGLALAYARRFNLKEAEEHLIRAIPIIETRAPQSDYLAFTLGTLGDIALDRGDVDVARFYFNEMKAIAERSYSGSALHASAFKGLARVALMKPGSRSAKELFMEGRKLHDGGVVDDVVLARILIQTGELDAAEAVLREAVRQTDTMDARMRCGLFFMLGYVDESQGDIEESLEGYRKTLAIAERDVDSYSTEARALRGISFVQFRKGLVEEAVATMREAVAALDKRILRISAGKSSEMLHRALSRGTYKHAVDLFIAAGMEEEAFRQLESYKGKIILELLHRRDLDFSIDLSEELEESRRQINLERDAVVAKLNTAEQDGNLKDLVSFQRELRAIDFKRNAIDREIVERSPRFAELSQPDVVDLQELRDVLDEETAFVSYSLTDNNVNIFVVTQDEGLKHRSLPVTERTVRSAVTAFREALYKYKTPSFRESFVKHSAELYKLVLEPVHDLVKSSRRLVLSPDGPLHFVSFGALVVEHDGVSSIRYLVEEKPLTVVSSGSLYVRSVAARAEWPAVSDLVVAAFGDADYAGGSTAAHRSLAAAFLLPEEVRFRSAVERGAVRFDDLPLTRREALGVTSQFERSQVFLGPEAREETVKTMSMSFNAFHFAVHGYVDPYDPLSSALVFTLPGEHSEGRDNGLLQVWELFESVRMDADLVVLSACETALGEEMGGEGLIGLTRAFQYAGARSVVASLWSVQDRATAALMIRFYEYLRAGKAKDEALQAAQVDLLHGRLEVTDEDGDPVPADAAAPYYWAPFQLYGDWR